MSATHHSLQPEGGANPWYAWQYTGATCVPPDTHRAKGQALAHGTLNNPSPPGSRTEMSATHPSLPLWSAKVKVQRKGPALRCTSHAVSARHVATISSSPGHDKH